MPQRVGGALKMEEKKVTIIDKVHPDLLKLPHILGKLIHLVIGAWLPDLSQQEQLVVHLTECPYCRTALIVLLSPDYEFERLNSSPEAPVHNLLTQFVTIHHEIEAQDYEHMGAYAEAIIAQGREEANKCFSVISEHVRRCSRCKSTLEETLAFLNEPEETD
jgi:hypothetical protein